MIFSNTKALFIIRPARILRVSDLIQGFADPRSNIHNCNAHLRCQGSRLLADSRQTVCQCFSFERCRCADFEVAFGLPDSSLLINSLKPENTSWAGAPKELKENCNISLSRLEWKYAALRGLLLSGHCITQWCCRTWMNWWLMHFCRKVKHVMD